MFFFCVRSPDIAERIMAQIFDRGDFKFLYKVARIESVSILRIYNLERLNAHCIEVLEREFGEICGYQGHIELTPVMVTSRAYWSLILLGDIEREAVMQTFGDYKPRCETV